MTDLAEATACWQRLLVLTVALWALAAFLSASRDGSFGPSGSDVPMLIECSTGPILLGILVGTAVTAAKLARALGLPRPSKWAGAWVPCCNPFVFVILTLHLLAKYREQDLSPRYVLRSRGEIERALAERHKKNPAVRGVH